MPAEIAILGAGPVGCTLALALLRAGRAPWLCARRAPGGTRPQFRPIALSHASRLILERVGALEALAATPIETIHVPQAGSLGRTRITAQDAGVPALGYVVDYGALGEALYARAEAEGVRIATAPEEAMLTVHAEGASEEVREKRYAQEALLARVACQPPATGTAFERFTALGPLALLPFDGAYAVVWGTSPERAQQLAEAPAAEFRMVVASFLTRRLGVPWQEGARHFMRHLVDGDPANNAGGWQWVAGTGTDPRRSRSFNPVRQARRFDPTADYVRRYVRELSGVPAPSVFAPWKQPALLQSLGYPEPVVPVPAD